MSLNTKALELVEKGLSTKTVSKLTESQIDILHSKLINEQTGVQRQVKPVTVTTVSQSALKSPQGVSIDGQQAKMDGAGNLVFTKTESKEGELGETKKNKKKNEPNLWAICHAQVGPKKTRKFERCVKSVKKQLEEGINPLSLFIESKIMEIVEKHMPPRITKADLIKYVTEQGPAVAPTKPTTKPTTKPDTKPTKRPHPGKNPHPGEKPAPKAKKISPEDAKDSVMDLIKNLLEK